MDRSVGKIVAFLEADSLELRRAAARVLGALRPSDAKVLAALTAALKESRDIPLRVAAIEAMGAVGGLAAFDDIVPFLEESGELGDRATDALGEIGPKALARLKRHFPRVGDLARRRILELGVRLRGAAGMDIIVAALERGDSEAVGQATAAGGLGDATAREKTTLLRRVDNFLGSVTSANNPGSVSAALDLLARIVGGKAQARLLEYSGPEHPPRVRRRALEALAELAPSADLESDLLSTVMGYLTERDFTHVIAPSMKVLEQARLGAPHAKALLVHMESSDPALRRFAVTALGQVDTPKSAASLLEVLRGTNPDLQKRAALSLARQRSAVPLAAEALVDVDDAATAWVLARILHPHAAGLKPDHVAALARAAVRWLEPGDPRAEPVLTVLRDNHLGVLEDISLKRVRRIRKGRVPGEVVNLLRPLAGPGLTPSNEVAYELALAEIIRGPKGVVREVRLNNEGLRSLERLILDEEFKLPTRLKRDKELLTPEEYYLIGCHFAERAYGDRAFGGELLRWLVQTFPEDIASRAAEHKLLMEGFPPPPRPRPKPARKPSRKKTPKAKPSKKKTVAKKAAAKKKKKAPARKPAAKKPARKAAKKAPAARKKAKKTAKRAPRKTAKKAAKKAPARKKTAKRATKATKKAAKRARR